MAWAGQERTNSSRAWWLTLAACAAAGAIGTPVVMHFMNHTPHQLTTPATLAGFTIDSGESAKETADYLRTAVAAGLALDKPIGAVYTNSQGDAHSVIVVGGRSTSGTVDARLTALFSLITDPADGVTGLVAVPTGRYGGTAKCGLSTDSIPPANGGPAEAAPKGDIPAARPATASDGDMAICGWADDSTVGLTLFPNRTVAQASELIGQIRSGIESQK